MALARTGPRAKVAQVENLLRQSLKFLMFAVARHRCVSTPIETPIKRYPRANIRLDMLHVKKIIATEKLSLQDI
jgi:hypothetical protein